MVTTPPLKLLNAFTPVRCNEEGRRGIETMLTSGRIVSMHGNFAKASSCIPPILVVTILWVVLSVSRASLHFGT